MDSITEAIPSMQCTDWANRPAAVRAIAQTLLTQYCLEEGQTFKRLTDLDPVEMRRYVDAASFICAWMIDGDRRDTAIYAMADVAAQERGASSILAASPREKKHLLALATSMLRALKENLKDNPPDRRYRDELCRDLDGLLPRGSAADKAVWS